MENIRGAAGKVSNPGKPREQARAFIKARINASSILERLGSTIDEEDGLEIAEHMLKYLDNMIALADLDKIIAF